MNTLPRRITPVLMVLVLCVLGTDVAYGLRGDEAGTGQAPDGPGARRLTPHRPPRADQQAAAARARDMQYSLEWDVRTGAPLVVRGRRLGQGGGLANGRSRGFVAVADPSERALDVLDNLGQLYRLDDARQEFRTRSVEEDRLGHRHVRLRQLHRGLRVVGGEVVVHFDAREEAYCVNGQYVRDLDLRTVARISPEEARVQAGKDLQARGLPKGRAEEAPELVVYALDGIPKIAYELMLVDDGKQAPPLRWRCWVDALDGSVIAGYNDVHRIDPPPVTGSPTPITGNLLSGEGGASTSVTGWSGTDGQFYLYDPNRDWFVFNTDTGTHARRSTAAWGTSDRAEMSSAVNYELIQQYYSDVHGRNSFDGAGADACVNVHEGNNYVNAYWDGTDFHFGDGNGVDADPLNVLDIAAHEFQHAVTMHSADLVYLNEPGALNEAFSDIFGALVEFHFQPDGRSQYPAAPAAQADWLVGEDAWLSATALRDLRNPANTATVGPGGELPSRYKGTRWYSGTDDNGGVHINSTVQGHQFYLLAEGGSGNNDGILYDFVGIGIANAGQVAYRALTVYCTQNTDYPAARSAWVSAAQDLNSGWVPAVESAWAAVGVGGTPNAVAAPEFTPPGGAYGSAPAVTLSSATAGAAIHYTMNGDEPGETSPLYTAPLSISESTTIKAKAFKSGLSPSQTTEAVYALLGTRVQNFPMDSNPGWTVSGQWAFGQPTGGGGVHGWSDPTSGFTGPNVYGYNLNGDYPGGLASTEWLTTTALDLSTTANSRLVFQRWLGVEQPVFDHAYIEVSNDGGNWTRIWENTATIPPLESQAPAWSQMVYDISSVADGQATVYIRWGLGPTDSEWHYCGWNIDDVEIWGDVLSPSIPTAPDGLSAAALSAAQIRIAWQDKSNNEQGFHVQRRTGFNPWITIHTAGANTTIWDDLGVVAATTYDYRVRAFNGTGDSDFSNQAQATTPPVSAGGDAWDSGDDTGPGATLLSEPTVTETVHGPHTLTATDTHDWYQVLLTAGATYNFHSAGGAGDTYAELFNDPAGTTLVAVDDDSAGGYQFSLTYTAASSVWHYLRVSTYVPGSDAGYNLTYSRPDAPTEDAWDPEDDSPATAPELNDPIAAAQYHGPHVLSDGDPYDGAWVWLHSGILHQFTTEAASGDTYAELYHWDTVTFTQVATDDDSGGRLQFCLNYVPMVTGWYYLDVSSFEVGAPSAYTLAYRSGSVTGWDVWEPDEYPSPTDLRAPESELQTHGPHTIVAGFPGDWDDFLLSLKKGVTYVFHSAGGMGDTFAVLYDDTLSVVAVDDDSAGHLQFQIVYAPTNSGWYDLEVSGYSDAEQCEYTLQYFAWWDPTITVTPEGGGMRVSWDTGVETTRVWWIDQPSDAWDIANSAVTTSSTWLDAGPIPSTRYYRLSVE